MNKKIIFYVLVAMLLVGLMVLTLFPGAVHSLKDSGSKTVDKCSPGPGYDEESWKEHMSHHPAMYKECL